MSEESNSSVQKNPPPTKLTLFYSSGDRSQFVRERLASLPYLVQQLGYKFTFEMPTVHCVVVDHPKPKVEKYINWRGKERERTVYPPATSNDCFHYFQFSRELSPEELDFWRVFKLGYLSRDFDPAGSWRKH
jgi:hypothetical protein